MSKINASLNQPMSMPKPKAHVIAAVTYTHGGDADLAPLDCICGWSGLAGAYSAHRLENGQKRANSVTLDRVFPER